MYLKYKIQNVSKYLKYAFKILVYQILPALTTEDNQPKSSDERYITLSHENSVLVNIPAIFGLQAE